MPTSSERRPSDPAPSDAAPSDTAPSDATSGDGAAPVREQPEDSRQEIVVAAVDDHPLVLRGLRAYLTDAHPHIRLDVIASSLEELLERWDAHIAVVLLDINLGDSTSAADNVTRLRRYGAEVVLFTSEHRPALIGEALRAGALGLVLKEDPESRIAEAITAAADGNFYVSSRLAHQIVSDPRSEVRLSEQESAVLRLLARGLPWSTIGKHMSTEPDTARTYCYRAMEKYSRAGAPRVSSPREMAYRALSDGHVDLDDIDR